MKPAVTPAKTIQQITQNDPSLIECDLSGNATYTLKSASFTKDVASALKSNTHLKKLSLSNLGVTDASVKLIAEALKENKTLNYLNLSKNKFGSAGLIDLAEAIGNNQTLEDIDLLGQSQSFGENALSKVIDMFSYNITLKNISWRLQSRQSFAINKLIVRNNEIERRLATGKSCMDILPESRKAEFVGMGGEVVTSTATKEEPGTEDLNNKLKDNGKEHPQESTESVAKQEQKTSQAEDNYPKSPREQHPAPQRPKPVVPSQHAATLPTAQVGRTVAQRIHTTGGGKMLSRYLQAAQADMKEIEQPKKVILPEGAGVSKAASIWHSRSDEIAAPDSTPKKTIPERPKVTSWKTKVVEQKPRETTVPKIPTPSKPLRVSEKTETSESPSKPLGVTGKAAVFESKAAPEVAPTKDTTRKGGSFVNKVASVWSAHEHEVKKTAVELPPGTGASRVASIWQQIAEETTVGTTTTKQVSEKTPKNPVPTLDTESPALNTEIPLESSLSPRTTHTENTEESSLSPRTIQTENTESSLSPRTIQTENTEESSLSPRTIHTENTEEIPYSPRTNQTENTEEIPYSPRTNQTENTEDSPLFPSTPRDPDLQDIPVSPRYSEVENLFPTSDEKPHEENVNVGEWENGE